MLMRRVRDKANDETQNKCTRVIRAEAVALVRLVKYVPRRGCDRNLTQTDSLWFAAAEPQVHGAVYIS